MQPRDSEIFQSPGDSSWSMNTPPSLENNLSLASGAWDNSPGAINFPLRSRWSRLSTSSSGSANHHSFSYATSRLHESFDSTHSIDFPASFVGGVFGGFFEPQDALPYRATIQEEDFTDLLRPVDATDFRGAAAFDWTLAAPSSELLSPKFGSSYPTFIDSPLGETPMSDNAVEAVEEQHRIANDSNFLHERDLEILDKWDVEEEWRDENEQVPVVAPTNYSCFVIEDGRGRATGSELITLKGRRTKPLDPEKRAKVAKRRKEGTTCLRCKNRRQEVTATII